MIREIEHVDLLTVYISFLTRFPDRLISRGWTKESLRIPLIDLALYSAVVSSPCTCDRFIRCEAFRGEQTSKMRTNANSPDTFKEYSVSYTSGVNIICQARTVTMSKHAWSTRDHIRQSRCSLPLPPCLQGISAGCSRHDHVDLPIFYPHNILNTRSPVKFRPNCDRRKQLFSPRSCVPPPCCALPIPI